MTFYFFPPPFFPFLPPPLADVLAPGGAALHFRFGVSFFAFASRFDFSSASFACCVDYRKSQRAKLAEDNPKMEGQKLERL